jgi:hypothetical protein
MSIRNRSYLRVPSEEQVQLDPPFDDFREWFSAVLENTRPHLIVGIARSALRLLQLQRVQELATSVPIVSNHALPFFRPSELEQKSILVFDDSVVFGSTIARVRDYLVQRGAHVECAAYVVDRTNFYGEEEAGRRSDTGPSEHSWIPLMTKHKLWPRTIRQHHELLIHRILQTPRSYNLEFPLLSIDVDDFHAADIPLICRQLSRSGLIRSLEDVSPPSAASDGVYRYTALLNPHKPRFLDSNQIAYRSYSKARVTFVPKKGEIRLRPLPQISTLSDLKFENVHIANGDIRAMWQRLRPPIDGDTGLYAASLLRLLTAFVATFLGDALCEEIVDRASDDLRVQQVRLITGDVAMLLGPENAKILSDSWFKLTAEQASSFFHLSDASPDEPGDSPDPSLYGSIVRVWKDLPQLRPSQSESLYEVVGKVFLSMRAATDTPKHRHDNPAATRLDVGMSYEGVRRLLAEGCDRTLTEDELSLAMDLCVDNGQAVPKILLNQSRWLRAFYSGEGEDSQAKQQLKREIFRAYEEFLGVRKSKPLTHFDFQKISVTLKDLLPWLPLSTKYYNFGRTALVGQAENELLPWLTDKSTGPLLDERTKDGKVLILNSSFRPCVNATWSPQNSQAFHDSFHHLASVFSKLDDRAKLLLSTCRTHRHSYNAVAFEAHSWVGHRAGNFEKFLAEARNLVEGASNAGPLAMASLYWCIRFISEAKKKYDIFYRQFDVLRKDLQKAFLKVGSTAKHFWEYSIEGSDLLDPTREPEVELQFNNLMPIIDQMAHLTSWLGHLILDGYGISLTNLERVFSAEHSTLRKAEFAWFRDSSVANAARQYNKNLQDSTVPGVSIVKSRLSEDNLRALSSQPAHLVSANLLDVADHCFSELGSVLTLFCPQYEVVEGDFPYSPSSGRRLLIDGSTETILADVFVLTLDLICSTNSLATNPMKDAVLEVFQNLDRDGFFFEYTGNDAYVAVSRDPLVLWDAAKLLRMRGDKIRQPGDRLDGTRKGISFGTVRVVRSPEGKVRIMDASFPNLLPRAFYMLHGVDEHCGTDEKRRNDVLAFDENALNVFKRTCTLPLREMGQVSVQSKHFFGKCTVVDISS